MPSIRAIVGLPALALLLAAGPAAAHQLNVFAFVEGSDVVVEARFSNGRMAREGRVTVYDASDRVVQELPLGEDGTLRLPVGGHADGLKVEVTSGDGHSSYWILTPGDLGGAEGQP